MYNQSFACDKFKSRDRRALGFKFLTILVCLIKLIKRKSSALNRNCKTLQSITVKTRSNKILLNSVTMLRLPLFFIWIKISSSPGVRELSDSVSNYILNF